MYCIKKTTGNLYKIIEPQSHHVQILTIEIYYLKLKLNANYKQKITWIKKFSKSYNKLAVILKFIVLLVKSEASKTLTNTKGVIFIKEELNDVLSVASGRLLQVKAEHNAHVFKNQEVKNTNQQTQGEKRTYITIS